jgi:hypothetical protein
VKVTKVYKCACTCVSRVWNFTATGIQAAHSAYVYHCREEVDSLLEAGSMGGGILIRGSESGTCVCIGQMDSRLQRFEKIW